MKVVDCVYLNQTEIHVLINEVNVLKLYQKVVLCHGSDVQFIGAFVQVF